MVVIDLDHLKAINDGMGHDVGNRAILALASHLKSNLRDSDFAARFGGDEFVALLPHQTAMEAAAFAERIRTGLRNVIVQKSDGRPAPFGLSVSVGIADHLGGLTEGEHGRAAEGGGRGALRGQARGARSGGGVRRLDGGPPVSGCTAALRRVWKRASQARARARMSGSRLVGGSRVAIIGGGIAGAGLAASLLFNGRARGVSLDVRVYAHGEPEQCAAARWC